MRSAARSASASDSGSVTAGSGAKRRWQRVESAPQSVCRFDSVPHPGAAKPAGPNMIGVRVCGGKEWNMELMTETEAEAWVASQVAEPNRSVFEAPPFGEG